MSDISILVADLRAALDAYGILNRLREHAITPAAQGGGGLLEHLTSLDAEFKLENRRKEEFRLLALDRGRDIEALQDTGATLIEENMRLSTELTSERQQTKLLREQIMDVTAQNERNRHLIEVRNADVDRLRDKLASVLEASKIASTHSAELERLRGFRDAAAVLEESTIKDDVDWPRRRAARDVYSTELMVRLPAEREAKEHTIARKTDDPESKAFWDFVDKRAASTDSWPEWKKREADISPAAAKEHCPRRLMGEEQPKHLPCDTGDFSMIEATKQMASTHSAELERLRQFRDNFVRWSLAYPELARDELSDAAYISIQEEKELAGDAIPDAWKYGGPIPKENLPCYTGDFSRDEPKEPAPCNECSGDTFILVNSGTVDEEAETCDHCNGEGTEQPPVIRCLPRECGECNGIGLNTQNSGPCPICHGTGAMLVQS